MSGVKDDDAWICSCYFLHRGQSHFMASYRRSGPRPLSASGFYSFVEDWDRCSGAAGHLVCRQAEFSDQAISVKVGCVTLDKFELVGPLLNALIASSLLSFMRKMSQMSHLTTKGRDTRLSDAVFTKASQFE